MPQLQLTMSWQLMDKLHRMPAEGEINAWCRFSNFMWKTLLIVPLQRLVDNNYCNGCAHFTGSTTPQTTPVGLIFSWDTFLNVPLLEYWHKIFAKSEKLYSDMQQHANKTTLIITTRLVNIKVTTRLKKLKSLNHLSLP